MFGVEDGIDGLTVRNELEMYCLNKYVEFEGDYVEKERQTILKKKNILRKKERKKYSLKRHQKERKTFKRKKNERKKDYF